MDAVNAPQEIATGADCLMQSLARLFELLSPFGTDSRFHWTGLAAFLILGVALFVVHKRRDPDDASSLATFLFPGDLYRTASSWLDVKVYFAGRFIKPAINAFALPLNAVVMAACAGLVFSGDADPEASTLGAGSIVAATLLVALVNDLSYYVAHRVSHESAWLWPFHKLHHSAEVLTPITAKRNHPVFDLLRAVIGIVMTAPISGIIFGLFGVIEFTTIFGVTLLIALMNVTGGALRHSHIWLDFGPVLDRIFISPAQHQIHHSLDPRHHDKNYGLTLAIWDWMFGTLYVPSGREALSFGVADSDGTPEPQVHHTLKDAYLIPFEEVAQVRRARSKPMVEERA